MTGTTNPAKFAILCNPPKITKADKTVTTIPTTIGLNPKLPSKAWAIVFACTVLKAKAKVIITITEKNFAIDFHPKAFSI